MRIVALIDMDCFYAQVEQREKPELWDTPVVVVQYAREGAPGGILAVSYEARPFGVKRGMMVPEAIEKCPSLNICYVPQGEHIDKADIQKYRDASAEVFDVLNGIDNRIIVERASVDEAFLDMTKYSNELLKEKEEKSSLDNVANDLLSNLSVYFPSSHLGTGRDCNDESAEDFNYDREKCLREWIDVDCRNNREKMQLAIACSSVEKIRANIKEKTQFYCSAGIGPNKMLSKLVCARHKPRQQTVICSEWVSSIFKHTKITDVRMLGGKTGNNLKDVFRIETMAQLAHIELSQLSVSFPSQAIWLHDLSKGLDDERVKRRESQLSIAVSKNFPGKNALHTVEDVRRWINGLCKELAKRLVADKVKNNRRAQNVVLGLVSMKNFTKTLKIGNYDSPAIFKIIWQAAISANKAPKNSTCWEPPILNIHLSASRFLPGISPHSRTIVSWVNDAIKKQKFECTSLMLGGIENASDSDRSEHAEAMDEDISASSWDTPQENGDFSNYCSYSDSRETLSGMGSLSDDGWQVYNPVDFRDITLTGCSSTFPADDECTNDIIDMGGTQVSKAVLDELPDFIRYELAHENFLSNSQKAKEAQKEINAKDEPNAGRRKRRPADDESPNDIIDMGGTKVSKTVLDELPDFIRCELAHENLLSNSQKAKEPQKEVNDMDEPKAGGSKRHPDNFTINGPQSKRIDSFFKQNQ